MKRRILATSAQPVEGRVLTAHSSPAPTVSLLPSRTRRGHEGAISIDLKYFIIQL